MTGQDPDEVQPIRPNLHIIYGRDAHSQLLVAELTRDWTSTKRPINPDSHSLLSRMNALRDHVRPHLTLVDARSDPLLRYRRDLPLWRIREHGQTHPFNPLTFAESSWPLLTVEALVYESTVDLAAWKRECRWMEAEARVDYFNEVAQWVSVVEPDDLIRFAGERVEIELNNGPKFTCEMLVAEYGHLDGFPQFLWQPPPKPRRPFPWEPDAKFHP